MDSSAGEEDGEGLFSKRSSSNLLSDPRILQHLRIVAQEAHRESSIYEDGDESEPENQKRELCMKINSYNKRNQLGAFKINAKENLDYEGALRFYFEDGGKELTKAVRLTNSTTVKDLLPILVEKFKPGLENELVPLSKLYAVQDEDEICLDQTEWPLAIALNATKALRFILRIKKAGSSEEEINEELSQRETSLANGKTTRNSFTDGPAPAFKSRKVKDGASARPMSEIHDFMYAGQATPIKMTSGAKYEPKPSKPKKSNRKELQQSHRNRRSLGAVLKLPRKGNSLSRKSTELSTNQLVPDVLKVFGDNISPDAHYKSVKATNSSLADAIVKQALSKYKLDDADASEFVLCDVVGYFKKKTPEQGQAEKNSEIEWVSEYARVVSGDEKPLVLQSYWKPTGNRLRRFELRRKRDIEAGSGKHANNNVASPTSAGVVRKKAAVPSPSDISLLKKKLSIGSSTGSEFSHTLGSPRPSVLDDESTSQSNLTFNLSTAIEAPYLLLLRGSGVTEDYLLHRIDEDVLTIGKPTGGTNKHPDIPLYSVDVREQHCQIYKKISGDNESVVAESDDGLDQVYIEPFVDCEVSVNGRALTGPALLRAGDLVQVGQHYVFLYKDPVQVPDTNLVFDWMPDGASSQVNGYKTDGAQGTSKVVQMRKISTNPNRLRLQYELEEEDKLLEFIVSICESVRDGDFELVASYLFILAIEQSARCHGDIDTRRLILKITNVVQAVAWDKTKGITETNVEGELDPLKSVNELLPDLRLILFWMSNALEMLHFLQDNLSVYLPNAYHVNAMNNDPEEEALANSDEELLNVLEEVAMFTFQQTVYHLTKVLYVALPLILDTNPFQKLEDDRDSEELEGAEVVVHIFQIIYDLITSFHVHHQIVRQLFAYLFFFTNASLFNTLMDRGAGGKFYRWAKGAQIRGNLDLLEGWAGEVGLQEEATDYLKKLSSAADVLATPKVQLLQSNWQNLRRDFPVLNAAQLHKILTEYQVGAGKVRPADWRPNPEDVEEALKDEEILESFSTHPPFLFPTSGYVLDLEPQHPHPVVSKALDALGSFFGPEKDLPPALDVLSIQSPDETTRLPAPQHSTPVSFSARTSPTSSVHSSPKKPSQKLSSSDPTLNHIDPNVLNNRLKNQVNGITKSASMDNLTGRTRRSGRRPQTDGGQQKAEQEVTTQQDDEKSDHEDGFRLENDNEDDVFVVELEKGESGIGVGLIDGLFTPLKSNGIYVRTLLPTGPASQDGRLRLGDRILAVNGTSLVGADYHSAMKLIRNAGDHLTFLVAKSDLHVAMKITASTC